MAWKVPNPQGFGRALIVAFHDLSRYLSSPAGKRLPTFDTEADRDRYNPLPQAGDEAMVGVTYWRYDGTTWRAWDPEPIAYTPTLNGITVGTGGNAYSSFTYQREGPWNNVRLDVVLGSSGFAVGSPCTITVPTGMDAAFPTGTFTADRSDEGLANYVCAGTGYAGYTRLETATTIRHLVNNASSSYLGNTGISNLIPATWAAGNTLSSTTRYRLA